VEITEISYSPSTCERKIRSGNINQITSQGHHTGSNPVRVEAHPDTVCSIPPLRTSVASGVLVAGRSGGGISSFQAFCTGLASRVADALCGDSEALATSCGCTVGISLAGSELGNLSKFLTPQLAFTATRAIPPEDGPVPRFAACAKPARSRDWRRLLHARLLYRMLRRVLRGFGSGPRGRVRSRASSPTSSQRGWRLSSLICC
jgi:hypothetical protein